MTIDSDMKTAKSYITLLLVIAISALSAFAQPTSAQLPPGVKVTRATESANRAAKSALEKAFANSDTFPVELLADTATCGPTLWSTLRSSADQVLHRSKVVTVIVPAPIPLAVPARGLIDVEQRKDFWKLLIEKYPALKSAKVRIPTPSEYAYYWSLIAFDSIEEPFLAIDAGPQTFIAHMPLKNGKPVLFSIDLIGDLRRLREQELSSEEVDEFVSAAEANAPIPMFTVGRAYFLGKGVPADVEKGRKWLEFAAGQESLDARILLGAAYMSGTKLPKDGQLAAKYLLQAAQQQNVDYSLQSQQALAQYWIALMYEQGSGVEKSHEKALQFLQLSANNGNYSAQYELANLYNGGLGGMQADKARACDLYEKAAAQGHPKAMHNTGYCYQTGSGGKKDEQKAIMFYTRAAEVGEVRSQRNLGLLYAQLGKADEAYFWLHVAESNGDKDLARYLDATTPHLTPMQIEALQRQVAEWLSLHKRK